MIGNRITAALLACGCLLWSNGAHAQYVMESLGRGVVAVRASETSVYVGWRLLGTDPADIVFNLYRVAGTGTPVKLNRLPLATTTDFVDTTADLTAANTYTVRPVIGAKELAASAPYTLPASAAIQQFLTVPLQRPAGGEAPGPSGTLASYTYSPNDASVGDLDGDGEYEIVLKWDPSNSRDTASRGVSGSVILDAYKLNGTALAHRSWQEHQGRRALSLRIYTTTIPAVNRMATLMHDPTYRLAMAWQNVGYNQPPHPGFFLGQGMAGPPKRNITVPKR